MPRVVVLIAGHRTGSGLTSQLLNMLGVNMGLPNPSTVVSPDDLGEDQDFVALHRTILRERQPSAWQRPRPQITYSLACQWVALARRRSSREIWGFKDPRFVFLADFGLGVLSTLLHDVQLVWLCRDAHAVALSLQKRDGTSYAESLAIAMHYETQWKLMRERYDGWAACDMVYEDLVTDPLQQVSRLAATLRLPASDERIVQAAGIVRTTRF